MNAGRRCNVMTDRNHEDDANNVTLIGRFSVIQEMAVDMFSSYDDGNDHTWECYQDVVQFRHAGAVAFQFQFVYQGRARRNRDVPTNNQTNNHLHRSLMAVRPRPSLMLMTLAACIMLVAVARIGAEEIVDPPPAVDQNKMHDQENQEEESKTIGATPTSGSEIHNGVLQGEDDDMEFDILGH